MQALIKKLILVATLSTAGAVGATPLITNGGFDAGTSGWNVNGGCAPGSYSADMGAVILNSCGESNSDPTVAQFVTGLVVGHTYQLSWDQALDDPYSGFGFGASFGVFLGPDGGTPLFTDEASAEGWQSMSTTFVATSTGQLITFAAELDERTAGVGLTTDVSYVLDNVALSDLSPASVPEPASLTLLGLGLAALVTGRRKRA